MRSQTATPKMNAGLNLVEGCASFNVRQHRAGKGNDKLNNTSARRPQTGELSWLKNEAPISQGVVDDLEVTKSIEINSARSSRDFNRRFFIHNHHTAPCFSRYSRINPHALILSVNSGNPEIDLSKIFKRQTHRDAKTKFRNLTLPRPRKSSRHSKFGTAHRVAPVEQVAG